MSTAFLVSEYFKALWTAVKEKRMRRCKIPDYCFSNARKSRAQSAFPELLFQQFTRNHEFLNLIGAFIDLCDLGITHHPFKWELCHILMATRGIAEVAKEIMISVGYDRSVII